MSIVKKSLVIKPRWKYLPAILFVIALSIVTMVVLWLIIFPERAELIMPAYVNNINNDGKIIRIDGQSIFVDGKKQYPILGDPKYWSSANFYILTKSQPLFSSKELDGEKLKNSLEYLARQQEILKKRVGLSRNEDIVPIDFLKAIPEVSRATDMYLSSPNTDNGKKLIESYRLANSKYKDDLGLSISFFQKYYPVGLDKKFNLLSSVSSGETVLSDLILMQKNAEQLSKEIDFREDLLLGRWKSQDSELYSNFVKSTKPEIKDYQTYKEPKLLNNTNGLGVDSRYFDKLRGPYIVNTKCFIPGDMPVYFYVFDERLYGQEVFMPKIATENYYIDGNTTNTTTEYDPQKNSEISLLSEGNSYRCNDLTYQADLLSLDEFQSKYGSTRAPQTRDFANLQKGLKKGLSGLVSFENKYYADKYKSIENLNVLGEYYLSAYLSISKDGGDNVSLANEMMDRYQLIHNKTSGLDRVTNTTFFINYLNDMYGSAPKDKNSIQGYLTLRSAYSFVYLGFSPTVWKIPEHPRYLLGDPVLSKGVYTYSDIIKTMDIGKILNINNQKTSLQQKALE